MSDRHGNRSATNLIAAISLPVLGAAGAIAAGSRAAFSALVAASPASETKPPAKIYGAFVYPPTEQLDEEGLLQLARLQLRRRGRQQSYLAQSAGDGIRTRTELWMAEDPPLDKRSRSIGSSRRSNRTHRTDCC